MRSCARRRGDETGFTLIEVLVVVVILGIIGFVLTEAIILGLRTTDATAASSSRSVATQALTSFFTGDMQSADVVSTSDPGCASGTANLIVTLSWTDQGLSRRVSYGLDPATGTDQELVRWSCSGVPGGPIGQKILGHFTTKVGDPVPVTAICDAGPGCPASGTPAKVTLEVRSEPTLALTVHRRTAVSP